MRLHANHRTCPSSRQLICQRVLEEGWTIARAAEAAGCSERTASKWLKRYREGDHELRDRSSRPKSSPRRLPAERVRVIEALRRLRMSAAEIAEILHLSLSTVSAWLKRIGLGKCSRLQPPEPPNRYERRHPGELVHVDIKKLGRIRGVGHRVTGSRASQAKTRREGRLRGVAGGEYVHVMIDDHSRLAYAEVLDDLSASCAVAFLRRALAWFAERGVQVRAVMSDNGACYVAKAYADALAELGLRHLRIRPGRPRTNGKAERFIQTLLREWAYGQIYGSSDERTDNLPRFLERYNYRRPHGSLGRQVPASRLNNVFGNDNLESPNSPCRTRRASSAPPPPRRCSVSRIGATFRRLLREEWVRRSSRRIRSAGYRDRRRRWWRAYRVAIQTSGTPLSCGSSLDAVYDAATAGSVIQLQDCSVDSWFHSDETRRAVHSFVLRPNRRIQATVLLMTAAVTAGLVGGAPVSGEVRFTDGAGASTVAAPTAIRIFVSLQPDRSNPRLLRGTSTVGLIYVFAGVNARIRRVRFYLDDPGMEKRPTAIRTKAPFDLRGHTRAGDALPLDTTRLAGGVHSMTAAIELDTGAERVLRARWIVPRLFVSPSGQDAAPCTASAPCRTLNRAYGLARPGQVVQVAPGDYGDQVVTGAKDAPGTVFDLQGAHLTSLKLHASYVEFRNGRIDRYTWDQAGPSLPDHVTFRNISASGFYMDGGSNIRIIGGELGPNTCASTGYAYINWIWSDGSTPITNVLLEGVSIHDNHTCLEGEHYEAVRIDENAVGVTIRDSHFQRNSIFHVFITDSGFSEASVPRDITIENNTFDRPIYGSYAIKTQEPSVQTCTNYTIRFNRFANPGAVALTCPKKVNVVVARNTVR